MNFTSFIGQAQTAIDGKGRTSFPREFRRQLSASEGNEFVVTRGPDRTLRLFVLPEFEKFMADLDSRSDRRQADLVRRGLCPTVVEMDGQNRILLPKILLVLKTKFFTSRPAVKLSNYGILNVTTKSMAYRQMKLSTLSMPRSMVKA